MPCGETAEGRYVKVSAVNVHRCILAAEMTPAHLQIHAVRHDDEDFAELTFWARQGTHTMP
jgi:hypothetical protein